MRLCSAAQAMQEKYNLPLEKHDAINAVLKAFAE